MSQWVMVAPYEQIEQRLRQQRSKLLLDATKELFVEKGYHNTPMDEIAAYAGVAKGTLYQHLARKVDLEDRSSWKGFHDASNAFDPGRCTEDV